MTDGSVTSCKLLECDFFTGDTAQDEEALTLPPQQTSTMARHGTAQSGGQVSSGSSQLTSPETLGVSLEVQEQLSPFLLQPPRLRLSHVRTLARGFLPPLIM